MVEKRTPIVGGNWKSNPGSLSKINELVTAFNEVDIPTSKCEVIVAPSYVHIGTTMSGFKQIKVAAQNCSKFDEGAFTGEVSAGMVKDLGLEWVVIGHSERRHKFGETDADLAEKVAKAQKAGLSIIFCIGELLEEREAGQTDEVCKRQVEAIISVVSDWSKIVIAYEPVWAIGTGKVATVEQAQEAHFAVRKVIADSVSQEVAAAIRIQYGGSVTPDNCAELIKCADVDGFLVGGASLKPTFMDIVKAAADSA